MDGRLRRIAAAGAAAVCLLAAPAAAGAADRVVNMIPAARSAETNQDAEPTLAVDPADYRRMAGSAFTWDDLTGNVMTNPRAPIYVSTDGGATWTLAYVVPSQAWAAFPTADITLSFSSTGGAGAHPSSWLYGGILSAASPAYPMTVLRTRDPFGTALMSQLVTRTGKVDQPHTVAMTALGGSSLGDDKVYVGYNNGTSCSAPGKQSAAVDLSQTGQIAAPAITMKRVEARSPICQDGFATVAAPHLDGTVYTAFIHDWSGSPRVVVVRDDAWASGSNPFTVLQSGSAAGAFVTPAVTLPSGYMGQNRLGASNVSIAVDPRNSDRVYVAWGDSGGGGTNTETIHVRRSTDRGITWSADTFTVRGALNPQIAINALGTVGVLYQQFVGSTVPRTWETHLVRSSDADATVFTAPGTVLAKTNADVPQRDYDPYLGDYASLVAAGKNFFGMFSASNKPCAACFLPGTTFQRYADWTAQKLYADSAHTHAVAVSIDPFFFEVDTVPASADFYVRDWTTDPTHGDNGAEQSTHPYFWVNSDLWNGTSATPLAFNANDQPVNTEPVNGIASAGDNYAFARIRRNAAGPPANVTLHFLVSPFGTGSNFVDVSNANVTLPPDIVFATTGGTGPWTSPPYKWHLNPTASTHVCLAIQIGAPGDAAIAPSLAGSTPGWWTGTNRRVIDDNNKAQRNMILTTVARSAPAAATAYAVVHNAALVTRDIPLRIGVPDEVKGYVRGVTVRDTAVTTGIEAASAGPGATLYVRGVEPGENRWVAVTLRTAALPAGATAYATAQELDGDSVVSGFGVGFAGGTTAKAIRDSLQAQRAVATRLAAGFGANQSAGATVREDLSPQAYAAFVHGRLVPALEKDLDAIGTFKAADQFGLRAALRTAAAQQSPAQLVADVASLLAGADAYLTRRQLEGGDTADIVQMVRWQHQLFRQHPKWSALACAPRTAADSAAFVRGWESRALSNADYPALLRSTGRCLSEALGSPAFDPPAGDLSALEKQHRNVLVALEHM